MGAFSRQVAMTERLHGLALGRLPVYPACGTLATVWSRKIAFPEMAYNSDRIRHKLGQIVHGGFELLQPSLRWTTILRRSMNVDSSSQNMTDGKRVATGNGVADQHDTRQVGIILHVIPCSLTSGPLLFLVVRQIEGTKVLFPHFFPRLLFRRHLPFRRLVASHGYDRNQQARHARLPRNSAKCMRHVNSPHVQRLSLRIATILAGPSVHVR